MSDLNAQQLKRVRDLHARILGGSTEHEREAARKKLDKLLRDNGKTWNDVPELIAQAAPQPAYADPRDAQPSKEYPNITPVDLVHAMLEDYLSLQPHEHVAVALWIIHTHVYEQFTVTPRLLLTSPVRGCGKTVALEVIDRYHGGGDL